MFPNAKVEVSKRQPAEVTAVIQVTMSPVDWMGFAEKVKAIDATCPFNIMKKQILDFVAENTR